MGKIILGILVGVSLIIVVFFISCGAILYNAGENIKASEQASSLYELSMQIQPGWKWEQERNYTYIRGRIKNAGDKITRYWAIEARYFGPNGEVLDKDMTNSAQNLYPGQMQTFEIMHKDDPLYKSVDLHVIEVRLQQ